MIRFRSDGVFLPPPRVHLKAISAGVRARPKYFTFGLSDRLVYFCFGVTIQVAIMRAYLLTDKVSQAFLPDTNLEVSQEYHGYLNSYQLTSIKLALEAIIYSSKKSRRGCPV